MRILTLFIITLISIIEIRGDDTPMLHGEIKEVVVTAKKIEEKSHNVGAKTTTISSVVLENYQSLSLSELLNDNSGLYIKSLGKGALSTVSFRGTSSNHTQVTWNGITLNSPTLGNFDFSSIPVFFTDKVTLYHGAGGNKRSSGSIGGSVNFASSVDKITSREIDVIAEYGSNNTVSSGLIYKDKFDKTGTSLAARLYFTGSNNDYEYLNKVLQKDAFIEKRQNADYYQIGVLTELYQKLKVGSLSTNIWWQLNNRNLPPSIIVNNYAKESTSNNNIRSLVSYRYNNLTISAAYLYEKYSYQRIFDIALGDDLSTNISNSLQLFAEQDFTIKRVNLGYGVNYKYDNVLSNNYSNSNVDRHVLSTRFFTTYTPIKWLILDAQIMAELNGKDLGPTYNVGIKVEPLKDFSIKASNAYNYRFPTLNDLYWSVGGNADLKPENGMSSDLSITYSPKWKNVYINVDLTGYYSNINDWIMWIPTGNGYIWRPANFNNVLSTGFEAAASLTYNGKHITNRLFFNYTYAYSVNVSTKDTQTTFKQLPYIPRNKWTISNYFTWRFIEFNYNVNFTDVRFTSADESYHTNAYFIHNLTLTVKQLIFKKRFEFFFKVENLFNDYYESTQYYPMPRRSFNGGIKVKI